MTKQEKIIQVKESLESLTGKKVKLVKEEFSKNELTSLNNNALKTAEKGIKEIDAAIKLFEKAITQTGEKYLYDVLSKDWEKLRSDIVKTHKAVQRIIQEQK